MITVMYLPQQCLSIKNIEVSVLALVRSHSVHHFISSQYGLLYVSLAPPLSACWPVSLSIKPQFELISVRLILVSPPPRLKGKLLVFLSLAAFLDLCCCRLTQHIILIWAITCVLTVLCVRPQTLSPSVGPAFPSDALILRDSGRLAQGH